MAKYRVYWTETVSCFMDVEESGRPESAEERVKHSCQTDDWQDKIARSKPMPDPNSFKACNVPDQE